MISDQTLLRFGAEMLIETLPVQVAVLAFLWFRRRISAATRHFYLAATIILTLAAGAASLYVPSRELGLLPCPRVLQPVPTAGEVVEPEHGAAVTAPEPARPAGIVQEEHLAPVTSPATVQPTEGDRGRTWSGIIGLLWVIGTTGLLLWIAGGFLYSVLIARRAVEEAEAEPVALLEAACERLGVRKTVAIVRSETVKVPVVVGLLHPKIILPTQALTWPRERLGAIFLHEAAHIRRLDLLVQFLARCTCALFWFNPLLWVIERKLFLAGECACDDAVIRHDVAATAYADYLMDTSVDLGTDRNPVWATAAMAEGTAFKDRILSILNPNLHREPPKSAHRTTVIFATGLILLPLIALSPWRLPSVPLPPADRPLQTEVGAGQQPEPDRGRPIYEPADPQDPGDRVSELIRLLRSSEADVREHAATALGELRDERAVGSLIALLDDPDAKVREHVATALGLLGDGRAFDPLLEAMRRDADARVREHAAPALGRLGDPRAFDPLLAVMRGGDVEPVRAHAAWGLGLLGDRRALPILIEALESGSESMRANAAMGLGELGDRGALDALARAERDRSRLVREQAALARQKIRSRGR